MDLVRVRLVYNNIVIYDSNQMHRYQTYRMVRGIDNIEINMVCANE